MNAIDGTGEIVTEPDWQMLLSDPLEIQAAGEHWRRITIGMRERETLAASNAHAVQRLVLAYIVYDRCSREVAERGAVLKPKRGNPKAISRLSPHFTAMREAASDAATLEGFLGVSPLHRGKAAKATRHVKKVTAADGYLREVKK